MKKWIAVIAAAAMVLSLAACGSTDNTTQQASSETAAASSSVQEASSAASSSEASVTESSSASATEETSAVSASSVSSETSSVSETDETSEDELLSIPIVDEDLSPEECVELGNYKGLEVEDTYVAPTQENVEAYMNSMLAPTAVEDENAEVAEGDTANIDYVGRLNGVEFDGGSAEGYDLVIGSGKFIPGFEDGVIGMKKGEVKDIDVTFPENYSNSELAGQPVVFTVTLNEIKQTPELNDEWVQANITDRVPDVTTVDGFREYLMDYFTKSAQQQAKSSMQLALWDQVMADTTVNKIPKSYYDFAVENFQRLNENDAQSYGMNLDEFLEANGITDENYEQLKDSYAREASMNNLVSDAVWNAEGMSFESEEYVSALAEIAESMGGVTQEDLIEQYGQQTIENYGKNYGVLARVMSYSTILPAAGADDAAEAATESSTETTSESSDGE